MRTTERNAIIERCAQLIDEGVERPGIVNKQDMCAHKKFGWEDCEACCAAAIRALKSSQPHKLTPVRYHAIERTSPMGLGQKYVGRCWQCGKTGLILADACEPCENPAGLTETESLLMAVEETAPPPAQADDAGNLAQQLLGRAVYLSDKGEQKTPGLLRQAEALIRDLVAALKSIDREMDDTAHSFATRMFRAGEIIDAALTRANEGTIK